MCDTYDVMYLTENAEIPFLALSHNIFHKRYNSDTITKHAYGFRRYGGI